MGDREPFVWIEIDMDGCSLTFGQGACTAALGGDVARKCFGVFDTCRKQEVFAHLKVFRTLRYCQPRSNAPKGATWWPVMQGEPSEFSAMVNIAGSDSDLSAFGRRATVSVTLTDFPDHDRYLDPYQAERVSGAAQANGIGYDPATKGTHFGRLKARWPYYSGRPLRVCYGYLVDGVITGTVKRHYVITNISGPDDSDKVTITGSDVLDLADDKRTRAPKPSNGKLFVDIGTGNGPVRLSPEGIGSKYPTSGRAKIGSEVVDYTRSGDVVTLTARGVSRTDAATHSAGDTFQEVLRFVGARIDDAVRDLLLSTDQIDVSALPLADWAAEVDRWLTGTRVTRDVTEPTGIKALISSMVPLGFSLWSDADVQEIRLKANRPVDGDTIWDLSDDANILDIRITEDDKQRASDVLFWTVQKDPTKSATSTDNYDRLWVAGDPSTREEWRYGTGEVKNFLCPWLDNGADAIVRVAAGRLLKRFEKTPKKAEVTLDAEKFGAIQLTDVVRLRTSGLQSETGEVETALFEVISRSEPIAGERVKITVQSYQFTGRFGYATPNGTPTYTDATPAQRDPGMFACDPITLKMPNGDQPYEAI